MGPIDLVYLGPISIFIYFLRGRCLSCLLSACCFSLEGVYMSVRLSSFGMRLDFFICIVNSYWSSANLTISELQDLPYMALAVLVAFNPHTILFHFLLGVTLLGSIMFILCLVLFGETSAILFGIHHVNTI